MAGRVLVVGAGPVGLTMACELARFGIPLRIIDKARQRTDKSKALVLWSRTLELLDRGANGAAPFVEAGHKVLAVDFISGDQRIGRVSMEHVDTPYAYALMLPQSDTERLLEERLASLGIHVERGVEMMEYQAGVAGVTAALRHPDGRTEIAAAEWLVGCDGAHSIVRHTLGVPFAGKTMDSDWMLADVHMSGYPCPDSEASVYWHRDGVFVIFPIRPGRYRLLADMPSSGAQQPPVPTLEQVQAMIDRRGPPGTKVSDPVWLAGFRINGRKVAGYRSGRVFLAGDAAHVHSPAGGQGMNTGMQDAFNLSWKLAMVIRGACGDQLLDSYTHERSAVGDEVLKTAERLTEVGTMKNHLAQHVRNLVGHVMLGLRPVQRKFADTMSEVAIAYPESPLNGPAAPGVSPKPGERVTPRQDARDSWPEAPRFALHAAPSQDVSELIAQYPALLHAAPRGPLHADAMILVRPDGYVACSAQAVAPIRSYLAALAEGRKQ